MADDADERAKAATTAVCRAIGCYENTVVRNIIAAAIREAVAAERERCAKLADASADQSRQHAKLGFPNEADLVAESIAEAIREVPT